MTLSQFADLVEAMRNAQKAYFSNRTSENLVKAKTAEQEVDKIIKTIK